MEKKFAIVNIPDGSMEDVNEIVESLKEVHPEGLGYNLIFIGGKQWTTISKDELIEVLERILNFVKNGEESTDGA